MEIKKNNTIREKLNYYFLADIILSLKNYRHNRYEVN